MTLIRSDCRAPVMRASGLAPRPGARQGARMASQVPTIFSPTRRKTAVRRALHLQTRPEAARFLLEGMVEDVLERLDFIRHESRRALVMGDLTGELAKALRAQGADVTAPTDLDEERPYPLDGFDLIVSLATLDTVNDLPGALIHIRNALAPGGFAVASFPGAGS